MATNNKKPTHTLRCANIKATIWQNISEKGPFLATTSLVSSRISSENGVMERPSASITLRLYSPSPVRPRNGLPLTS